VQYCSMMNKKVRKTQKFFFLDKLCVFLVWFLMVAVPTNAQETMKIAALVNNEIITVRDIKTRMQILLFASKLRPTKAVIERLGQQVLETLVDEKLKLEAAKKNKIVVKDEEFLAAVATLEKSNKIEPGRFRQYLTSKGIDWGAMSSQIRAQILWSKLLRRILLPRVFVSESEISTRLKKLSESGNKREYHLSEILLSVDEEGQRTAIQRNAKQLIEDITKGADFGNLARQFSDSTSYSVGGDIGWQRMENLPTFIRPHLIKMGPGDVFGPISSVEGFYIIRLNQIRETAIKNREMEVVDLRRMFFKAGSKISREDRNSLAQRIESIRNSISSCKEFDQAAKNAGFSSDTKLGKLNLKELSREIIKETKDLPIGRPSLPIQIGEQMVIFAVCQRWSPSPSFDREQVRQTISKEKLDITARRYMRDIKVSAIIDIRM